MTTLILIVGTWTILWVACWVAVLVAPKDQR